MKVLLLYVGRPRDRAANAMAQEYARRIGFFCDFRMQQVRDERSLERHPRAYKVLLDAAGRQIDSSEFARLIQKAEAGAVREVVFFVGGAEGLPSTACEKADMLLSLSRLTLPHELARVVLAEQIYRAFTILRGHPYAK